MKKIKNSSPENNDAKSPTRYGRLGGDGTYTHGGKPPLPKKQPVPPKGSPQLDSTGR